VAERVMKILMVSRWIWEERKRSGGKPGFFGELAQAVTAQGVELTLLSQAVGAASIPELRPVDGLNLYVFCRDGRSRPLALLDKLLKGWGGYRKAATDAAVIRRFVREHGPFDAVVAQCEEPDGLAFGDAGARFALSLWQGRRALHPQIELGLRLSKIGAGRRQFRADRALAGTRVQRAGE
jgi:hypothetical protein